MRWLQSEIKTIVIKYTAGRIPVSQQDAMRKEIVALVEQVLKDREFVELRKKYEELTEEKDAS